MDELTKREKKIIRILLKNELINLTQNPDLSFKKEDDYKIIEKEYLKDVQNILDKLENA